MGKLLASHTGQGSPVRESSHLFPTLQDQMEPMHLYVFSKQKSTYILNFKTNNHLPDTSRIHFSDNITFKINVPQFVTF